MSVTIAVEVRIPATGYTTLTVKEAPKEFTRHPVQPGMAASERSLENEVLYVSVENDGTLSVIDKRNGNTYFDLMRFEDRADIGDGWYHGAAANDETLISTGPVEIAKVTDGLLLTQFRIRQKFEVPAQFDYSAMWRSTQRAAVVIETLVSLRPEQEYVEVEHTIENTAKDHRMRVVYPSGMLNAETYWADSQFDVVKRPIELRLDNHLYRELEVDAKPQQSWTAVTQKRSGLAIVSAGQLESAVLDFPDHPIAVTLFRSVRRTVNTEGEPDGLMLGTIKVKQYIVPVNGKLQKDQLFNLAQRQTNGLRVVQMDANTRQRLVYEREIDLAKTLPVEGSFFSIEGKVVFSSARQVGDGFELRLFNPTNKDQVMRLEFGEVCRYHKAWLVNLLSEPIGEEHLLQENSFEWILRPKQIVTLRFQ